VDHTIHLFDPSIELEEIKARPVPPRHQADRPPPSGPAAMLV
jgi:hypothetical protein